MVNTAKEVLTLRSRHAIILISQMRKWETQATHSRLELVNVTMHFQAFMFQSRLLTLCIAASQTVTCSKVSECLQPRAVPLL
jgi:hypothetical protein